MLLGLIHVSLGVLEQAVRESWSAGMWGWPPGLIPSQGRDKWVHDDSVKAS